MPSGRDLTFDRCRGRNFEHEWRPVRRVSLSSPRKCSPRMTCLLAKSRLVPRIHLYKPVAQLAGSAREFRSAQTQDRGLTQSSIELVGVRDRRPVPSLGVGVRAWSESTSFPRERCPRPKNRSAAKISIAFFLPAAGGLFLTGIHRCLLSGKLFSLHRQVFIAVQFMQLARVTFDG